MKFHTFYLEVMLKIKHRKKVRNFLQSIISNTFCRENVVFISTSRTSWLNAWQPRKRDVAIFETNEPTGQNFLTSKIQNKVAKRGNNWKFPFYFGKRFTSSGAKEKHQLDPGGHCISLLGTVW